MNLLLPSYFLIDAMAGLIRLPVHGGLAFAHVFRPTGKVDKFRLLCCEARSRSPDRLGVYVFFLKPLKILFGQLL